MFVFNVDKKRPSEFPQPVSNHSQLNNSIYRATMLLFYTTYIIIFLKSCTFMVPFQGNAVNMNLLAFLHD